MHIFADGRALTPEEAAQSETQVVYLLSFEELEQLAPSLGMGGIPLKESASTRFESRPGWDCLMLHAPAGVPGGDKREICANIYCNSSSLVIAQNKAGPAKALAGLLQAQDGPLPAERALYTFFDLLTREDGPRLEDLEESIAQLEDAIANGKSEGVTQQISMLRKKLLRLKRYYEGLYDALVDLEENQNGFLIKGQLTFMHIITNRVDRLNHSVLNLRDYVTQVREAYQAQLDIQLNQTMKMFTVITTIFLPLSLIAGWYGMNLEMPEYGFRHAYPFVILASLLVVVVCIWYFKRKKWF